ncbi:hypothetical protein N7466_005760 [Penicillium verhagenii]|uniref:uncharacterized protein n=1 Tax=Penicillium verhagenii TaxID=1562060 RepID=UPI0025451DD7|nr:uncharacterized protein N7466_005760 [Penicillium verhagenii]KAJ5930267.1 hypothetical protein N7466_005760 [Penicillium verhagenii]
MARFLGLRGTRLSVMAIIGVLMPGIITVGYNTASLGGVLSLHSFNTTFPQIDVHHAKDKDSASSLEGTAVAAFAIGSFLGTFACIWLGDWLGRRRTIMLGATTQIIGYILSTSSFSLVQLIAARIIVGMGTGTLLATIPLWISETSPAKQRGSHVVTKGIFTGVGCATALFLEFGMSFKSHTTLAWRLPFAFPTILSFSVLCFILLLPESPRWLIQKDRIPEARYILAALADTYVEDESIEATVSEVQASLSLTGGNKAFKELFQMGPQRTFHRASLAVGGMLFLQFTGATVTTFYTTAIFESNLDLAQSTARLLAAVYQLAGPLGAILCVFLIEGVGRRRLMMCSALGNMICLACIAGLGSQVEDIKACHAAVFFLFLFHFCYIIGFGGIPYLYATEVAPLHLRATINSVSISVGGAVGILIAHVTPLAFNKMGEKYFFVFAGLNAIIVPSVYFLFPETSGRTLEEIDDIFTLSDGVLDTVRVARTLPCLPAHGEIESPIESNPKFQTILKEREFTV